MCWNSLYYAYHESSWYENPPPSTGGSNSIQIPEIPSHYCFSDMLPRFDTTYPTQLQSYLTQNDWNVLISQINQSIERGLTYYKLAHVWSIFAFFLFLITVAIAISTNIWELWFASIGICFFLNLIPNMIFRSIYKIKALKALDLTLFEINDKYKAYGLKWKIVALRVPQEESGSVQTIRFLEILLFPSDSKDPPPYSPSYVSKSTPSPPPYTP